jgi:hypothetical protein
VRRPVRRGVVIAGLVAAGCLAVAVAAPTEVNGPASATKQAKRNIGATLAGCPIYPADNAWNQAIDRRPIRAGVRIPSGSLHPDFGEFAGYGIPYVVVPANQALVPISYTDYGDESDPGPFPIPLDAPVEGGGQSGDRHVIALQQGTCQLFELFVGRRSGNGWSAASGAKFDLTSNALRPLGWTSADAAGLPILPGLVKFEEVAAGRINHAIRVTFGTTRRGYILPATHFASSDTDPGLPAMGQRFRLRADYDISGLTGQARVIAEAMKVYGLIVADNGSNWYFQGAPNPGWDDDDLGQLKRIPGSAFEAVDTGPVVTTSS